MFDVIDDENIDRASLTIQSKANFLLERRKDRWANVWSRPDDCRAITANRTHRHELEIQIESAGQVRAISDDASDVRQISENPREQLHRDSMA